MDRLSQLPDELLAEILYFLPMRDVVKTPVLSKRWRNLWTTIPSLNFENDTMRFHATQELQDFVNQALNQWKGTHILKFKFETCHELKQSISSGVDYWVVFAMRYKVEELYLHMKLESMDMRYCEAKDGLCTVPLSLYSCSSLKVLSFRHFIFIPPQNVHWNHLKSLTITEGFGITGDLISQILSGSPQLEVLIFSFAEGGQTFNIESESLKELSIEKYLFEHDDLCFDSELRISTPKLENLKLLGVPYNNCALLNISSLSHATLGFSGLHYFDQVHYIDFHWEEFGQEEFDSAQDFVGDKLSQILQTIHLVANVTLFCCCVRVIEAMENRSEEQSSFPNVKFLKIGCCHENYAELVGLLQIFPQLERLVLQNDREDFYLDDEEPLEFDADSYQNLPESFLLQLRTIDVTWDEKDSVFPFIEILLKYASKLEHMVFRAEGIEHSSLSSAEQKLLRMPRSSCNCKFDFRMIMPISSSRKRRRSSDSEDEDEDEDEVEDDKNDDEVEDDDEDEEEDVDKNDDEVEDDDEDDDEVEDEDDDQDDDDYEVDDGEDKD